MTLTGMLVLENGERPITSVAVSLQDGIGIWARDALNAHRQSGSLFALGGVNPQKELPAGSYNLPLMVQVPDTKLPASFEVEGARFAIHYFLTASLSAENPVNRKREVLSTSSAPFVLLPTTLPDFPVTIQRVSNLTWHRCGINWRGSTLTRCVEVAEKWAFEPTL
jgi:hypothetical protein